MHALYLTISNADNSKINVIKKTDTNFVLNKFKFKNKKYIEKIVYIIYAYISSIFLLLLYKHFFWTSSSYFFTTFLTAFNFSLLIICLNHFNLFSFTLSTIDSKPILLSYLLTPLNSSIHVLSYCLMHSSFTLYSCRPSNTLNYTVKMTS